MANLQKIKTLVKEKNMTLADLAEQIGITPTGLSLMIRDGKTMTDKLENIAHILNVRVGVFFDEDEVPAANATEQPDLFKDLLKQKDEIIAQKDTIIAQKDELIRILVNRK